MFQALLDRLSPRAVMKTLPLTAALLCSLSMQPASSHSTCKRDEHGVLAHAFDLGQVRLTNSRWMENQNRTLNYVRFVDADRLLYNFRANHELDTLGAEPAQGWEAPDFPFRTHSQGHFLTAWAQCYAVLSDDECGDLATYFVEELAKCQANNEAAGFSEGYLSGFPESEIEKVEDRTLSNGNVPYYSIHKTMAGLLDVWKRVPAAAETASQVLLAVSAWVDTRTGKLSYEQMQTMMQTEFGGMNEVLADVYHQTGDDRWLKVAQRFDHARVFDPLANNQDALSGLHANTQVPKWIGAVREYKATGTSRYLDIGLNAFRITVNDHTYAIGGNSQSEHFRDPDAIAKHLVDDTCEHCNTYNMLKLARELWVLDPTDSSYFDLYERALVNHLIGAQDPTSEHGHITYFTSLKPGGRRGIGPAWGGEGFTYTTDYTSFWCCQGTAIETNTKLMDSIYFHDDSTLFVNLYTPSELSWTQKGVSVKQSTSVPESDTATFTIEGDGDFDIAFRVPTWVKSGATIRVNDGTVDVEVTPGAYATVPGPWSSGDIITVEFPPSLYTIAANDDPSVAALAFGPVVLAGNFGEETLDGVPDLDLSSLTRVGDSLMFEGTSGGETVSLGPFYDAHGFNYNTYWKTSGELQ